ncbi:MAG TPA: hypothetical protein VKX33_10855 [Cyclobacteriaceae bacterium]|nr:hypothetical protein [Cyclobacteriaceae bacterium]
MIKKLFRSLQKEDKDLQTYLNNKEAVDQYLEYLSWGTHLPVAHVVKQNNIRKYQEAYQYQVFVETGTFLGDMVEAQKAHFKKIISIELGEDLYQKAVERFKNDAQVSLLQGDSGIMLKQVVQDIDEAALFWLDGHYSSGITAKSDKNTPIVEELKTILNSPIAHGILIDDARHFIGKDDYPSIDEICFLVKENSPQRKVEVADDIIRIMP